MKTKRLKYITLLAALALVICAVFPFGAALSAEEIYVNDAQSQLGVPLNSAYAVGTGGSVGVVGDTYVLTDSGTVKIGQTANPVPNGNEDGTTIRITATTARIGLYYYYSASRDYSLETASLENSAGSGYKFGYFDSNRVFQELGSTNETQITMKPTGGGREVSVYITGTETLLYRHTDASVNLAVHPVNQNGKALTWFKSNKYYGDFEYYRYIADKLTVINVVNAEDYVKGVVIQEMSASWPLEALKAQAVCARTYWAKNVNSYSQYGFDITADTYCQAYFGTIGALTNSDRAVDETAGKYVTYNGQLCETLYYSSNGGGSENSENVFTSALPYLRGVLDPYEKDAASINPNYNSWTRTRTKTEIASKINASGKSFGTFASMSATYSATNNVIGLLFTDTSGKTASYSGNACFNFIYTTGFALPSIHFTFEDRGDSIVFNGGGLGHSVGMSQFGAWAMANSHGFNYLQILRYYYTGVNISIGVQ